MFFATAVAARPASVEIGMLVVLLRDREGGAVVDDRLHRRADRARVGDVVAEVRAVVDAGRDEVEAVPEVAEEGEADRVGRRAVDRVGERPVGKCPLADAQRAHERLLVADRALVRVGRDDGHLAHPLERLLEREQPARLDAVVVGDEDPRSRRPLAERRRASCAAPADRHAQPHRRPARRAPCRGRAARSGPVPGSCPGHRPRRSCRLASTDPGIAGGSAASSTTAGSSMSVALPGVGSRGMRTGLAVAFLEPPRGAAGDGPVTRRAVDELEHEAPTRPPRSGSRRSPPGCRRSGRRSAPTRGRRSGGCRPRPA